MYVCVYTYMRACVTAHTHTRNNILLALLACNEINQSIDLHV